MVQHEDVSRTPETRLSRKSLLATAVVVSAGVAGLELTRGGEPVDAAMTCSSQADDLSKAMRKLWEDHITWTRLFIVSFVAGLPDLDVTTQRLLRNQTDIGNAITPFYDAAAGQKLTELLKQHILGAAALLQAAKAGDSTKIAQTKADWYTNADQIAVFLHNANPAQWPLGVMKDMMRRHLNLTLAEAVAHLQGKYAEDIAAYDRVHDEILSMADMLTAGIVAQFPRLQGHK